MSVVEAGHRPPADLAAETPLLDVTDLVVEFSTKAGLLQAVSGVSFAVEEGETLGIVGESGCGKSTTGRALLRLSPFSSGTVTFDGEDIGAASPSRMRELRRGMQMIFQDPLGSLNPRRKVRDLVVEGLKIGGAGQQECERVAREVMEQVGLPFDRFADRYPRALSGGQAQRVAIARAIAVRPRLLICDEPVSALDVSVQAQILNLLEDLKEQYDLTLLFVAHDLGVVRSVSDKIMVMYLGKVVEFGDPDLVYDAPAHPYTRGLLDSVPEITAVDGFTGPPLTGDIPSPLAPPSGCRFRTRCPRAEAICADEEPAMRPVGSESRLAACHFPLERTDPNPSSTPGVEP